MFHFDFLSKKMQQLISQVDERFMLVKQCKAEIDAGHANETTQAHLKQLGYRFADADDLFVRLMGWSESDFYGEMLVYDGDRFHELILRIYATKKEELLLALQGEIFLDGWWEEFWNDLQCESKHDKPQYVLRLDTLAMLANLGGTILETEIARNENKPVQLQSEIEDRNRALDLAEQKLDKLMAPDAMKTAECQTEHSIMINTTEKEIGNLEVDIDDLWERRELFESCLRRHQELVHDEEYVYGLKSHIFKAQDLLLGKFSDRIVAAISEFAWVDGTWYQKKRPRDNKLLDSAKRLKTTE